MWIFGAAVAASRLLLSPTWNTDVSWFIFEAHNRRVSALVLVSSLVSFFPELVLNYASVRIVLPRYRPSSQTSLGAGAVDQRRRRRFRNGESLFGRGIAVVDFRFQVLCD